MFKWYIEKITHIRLKRALRKFRKLDYDKVITDSEGNYVPFEEVFFSSNICVVGNSPVLLDKGLGEEIDKHDIVVRINDYSIEGFEKDVGTKETVWISCAGKVSKYKGRNLKPISHSMHLSPYLSRLNFKRDSVRNNLHLHDEDFLYFSTKLFTPLMKWIYPSSGIYIIIILLGYYNKFNVCGFSFFSGDTHYFERIRTFKHCHNFELEKLIFNKLLKDGKINSLTPIDFKIKLKIRDHFIVEKRRIENLLIILKNRLISKKPS